VTTQNTYNARQSGTYPTNYSSSTVGEQQEGCMIDAVFEQKSQAETRKSSHRGRRDGTMVAREFQLPGEPERWHVKDREEIREEH
jgi:hypothetical protein